MTFKQLEAIYWVVRLGGFAQAANKLHTTQSAISKRIQELETLFDTTLFDRSARSARLTERGDQMFELARRMLEQRDSAIEGFQLPHLIDRHVRIGITELTAMTWLPRLVSAVQQRFNRVVIVPIVNTGVVLRDKLVDDDVDLMIVPDAVEADGFESVPLGEVDSAWMCKPGLVGDKTEFHAHEMASHRLLIQDERSGTGPLYNRWLRSLGHSADDRVVSNSVLAIIGLTISGLGISYLPKNCLTPMLESGVLQLLTVTPTLPPASYAAVFKGELGSTIIRSIADLAAEQCDFGRIFQTE
ncbi:MULTISPECIES: LysR family transcriptional regulator [unclassified Achromobacter]|uniref:LysR family transcriptional regulator n=1 Tax=unclassified Achromobacter TaxID=2626865 RepID=UPI000B5186F4|nr:MULTISPECIES: LysR family transcriptional regulator [unclassified Achromobacter]OWT77031.1 LysR family transcriptional regulator [Achromobacter sp. HZ28]OWT77912.1 LysR family transcriptional regulator [Achromobacter sp. HZ34]